MLHVVTHDLSFSKASGAAVLLAAFAVTALTATAFLAATFFTSGRFTGAAATFVAATFLRAAGDAVTAAFLPAANTRGQCPPRRFAQRDRRDYALMQSETYKGYNVWGHAILQKEKFSSLTDTRRAGRLLKTAS